MFLLLSYCSNLAGEFYTPERLCYPALCKDHYANDIATKKTWIESCGVDFLNAFANYFKYIPKPYEADCYGCSDCGGVNLDLYNNFDLATDGVDAFDEVSKGHKFMRSSREPYCIDSGSHCEHWCWDGGYFRKWNHKYSHFFHHFLCYCAENESCDCFWSEKNLKAVQINNKVYSFIKSLCDEGLIDNSFSSYWFANEVCFDYHRKFFGAEYYPNAHGMASSLTTYTFFYSQYHQMLLSVAACIDSNTFIGDPRAFDMIYDLLESLRIRFTPLYDQCIRKHPHPKIYYERGMLHLHSGNAEEALNDIHELMRLSSADSLTSEMFQQEGESYADLGVYDKAIASLKEAILRNPDNLEAYFYRAHANFESGNFEQALKDYVCSKKSDDLLNVKQITPIEFSAGLLDGLTKGGYGAATEFFPSLWYSVHGLSQTIWTATLDSAEALKTPNQAMINFGNASYEMVLFAYEKFKKFNWDTIEDFSYELKDFYTGFEKLPDVEKGRQCGLLIGKFGVDIFAGGSTIKSVAVLKKLKNSNKICCFEAMTASKANKKGVVSAATLHAENRIKYFENVRYNFDAQNKHILGHNDYDGIRSIWTHSEPERLLRQYAGKGHPERGIAGTYGFKETVDFGETIGIWKSENRLIELPTTRGTIHYGKKGGHIVPIKPLHLLERNN